MPTEVGKLEQIRFEAWPPRFCVHSWKAHSRQGWFWMYLDCKEVSNLIYESISFESMTHKLLWWLDLRGLNSKKLARSWSATSKLVTQIRIRWIISYYCPAHSARIRSSTSEALARSIPICSEHKSRAIEFSAGYTETVHRVYQGDIIAGSNECLITRIYSLTKREKRIYIFDNG
jgi:hypothetical protein